MLFATPPASIPCVSSKPLVLILDRDHATLHIFQVALLTHGYRTLAEQSALAALEKILHPNIEALVLGPNLYNMDGAELVRRIRARRPLLPILIVSDEPFWQFQDAPHTRILEPPSLPDSICNAVDALLPEAAPQR